MEIRPLFTIGEVVRDKKYPNSVNEIVGIITNVTYDRETIELITSVSYVIVDIKVNTHMDRVVEESRLLLTDIEDIGAYLGNEELKDLDELDELVIYEYEEEEQYTYNDAQDFEVMYYKEEEERSTDDLLDEYNDYQTLIDMFGDDDGHYKKRCAEIIEELMSRQKSK